MSAEAETLYQQALNLITGVPRGREVRVGVLPGSPIVFVYEVRSGEVVVVSRTHARSIRSSWRRRSP
jgi:hypothetical protein